MIDRNAITAFAAAACFSLAYFFPVMAFAVNVPGAPAVEAPYIPPVHPCDPKPTQGQTPKLPLIGTFCGKADDTEYCYPNGVEGGTMPKITTEVAGVVSGVIGTVKTQLEDLGKNLFNGIVGDPGFQSVVKLVLVLYLSIYGVMIWFNMASYSPGEVMNRILKMGVVIAVVSPGGWDFLRQYFSDFFTNGIDSLINFFNSVGYQDDATTIQGIDPNATTQTLPLSGLDHLVSKVFSRHFLMMMGALMFTGPFGLVCFVLLVVGLSFFFTSVIMALVTYIRAVVALYFLFGIAPIFICFSLFSKTRGMFAAWMEQIVGFFLQPVLTFAFLSFFVSVIGQSADKILMKDIIPGPDPTNHPELAGERYCWTPFFFMDQIHLFNLKWFRGAACNGTACTGPNLDSGELMLYTGPAGENGPPKPAVYPGAGPLPMNTSELFLFILWGFLAFRYMQFIKEIAENLTDKTIDLMREGKNLTQWFTNRFT